MQSVISVLTPPITSRLTTLATVRAAVGDFDGQSDATIERLIDVASSAIARYIGARAISASSPSLGVQTVFERFSGGNECGAPLVLGLYPVTAINFIDESGVRVPRLIDDGLGGTMPNPAFAYDLDAASGILWKFDGIARRGFNYGVIAANYISGWVLPGASARTLPHDIEDACILYTLRKFQQLCAGAHVPVKQESFAGIGSWTYAIDPVTWRDGMPSDVAAILNRWRRQTIV